MAAEQIDVKLFLESNGVEDYGRLCDLLSKHGIGTVEQFSALAGERLLEWGIRDYRVHIYALPRAQTLTQALVSSPQNLFTVKQQLLVS